MKKKKSTKMFAETGRELYTLIKSNIHDSYFMDVLYFYLKKSLLKCKFNLNGVDGFFIDGRYFGDKKEILFDSIFNTPIKSISLILSIRALIINKKYLNDCYNDKLLFYDIDSNIISWNAHRAIIECLDDDEFNKIYYLLLYIKDNGTLSEEQKSQFEAENNKPEFRNEDLYYKTLASDPDYNGVQILKNNEFLCSDIEEYEVHNHVRYVGDFAFAFCDNLKSIVFPNKVTFGKYPIIECKNLKSIVVPAEYIDYFKEALPYYTGIIKDTRSESIVGEELIWHVFDKKATSYKYFWFMSILQIYNDRRQISIPYKNIIAKMVANAWSYVLFKGYNFNSIDQLPNYIFEVKDKISLSELSSSDDIESAVLENYNSLGLNRILEPLLKNVPYRFLCTWIPFTTKEEVIEKSRALSNICLYSLYEDCIVLNENWLPFLKDNYLKLTGFATQELKSHLKE